MDIDSQLKVPVIPPDQTLISEKLRNKGGQGSRPQYYRQQPPPEPPPEEEIPAENGKPKHLIDIKV
ncbi:MAG: hypothetical protein C4567_10395 [Deltaproteobacteria bacterium]|nr:MAG: hypothetical protein C4567_10395 [Deltaproteobacteria bacterium]